MSTEPLLASQSIGEGVPIVIIPGWEANGELEARDLEPIFTQRTGFRRIFIDPPGTGSTPFGNTRSLDDIYARIVHFIDNTLGTSKFLLVGTSAGGYLARAVCHKYRDQVIGLMLRVPLVEPDNSKRDLDPFEILVQNAEIRAGLSPADRKRMDGLVVAETPEYVAALATKLDFDEAGVKTSDQAALATIRNDTERYRLSDSLIATEPYTAPTLIVCGRQDTVVGYRDALRLLNLYPRATFALLDRATHFFPVTEQDTFKALVYDWLDRVQECSNNTR